MGDIPFPGGKEKGPGGVEGRLAALAGRQHGLVTSRQLTALGVTYAAACKRARAGRLHRIHLGVYAVGHPGLTFEARCLAAVMAAGPCAVLSHRAAAALWQLCRPPAPPFDVITQRRSRHGPEGIRLHRVRGAPQVTRLRGTPVTTVAQTLLDLAATVPRHELERAIREAHAIRAVDREELRRFVRRAGGRPGAPALRDALGLTSATRSVLERRFLALCRRSGLEPPGVNESAAGVEVDFLWESHRLVVEVDGFTTHATRHGFESDREHEARLTQAGLQVLRFSDRQITQRPGEVLATLRAAGIRGRR